MISRLLGLLEQSRFLQLFIVTACVQGAVLISQFLIAPFVEPAMVGMVRSLETVIALVVLAGSLGMQSIVIRDVAACTRPAEQAAVFAKVITLVCVTSLVVMLGIWLFDRLDAADQISMYVSMSCGLVLLTNLLRMATGFAQGARAMRTICIGLLLTSGLGVLAHVALTRLYGIQGWVVARYLTEFCCLLVVCWQLRSHLKPAWGRQHVRLGELAAFARSGAIINLGLFARLLVTSLPMLMLSWLYAGTDDVGMFGLAILMQTLGLLPLAIIAQKAVPDLVNELGDREGLRRKYRNLLKSMALVSLVAMLLTMSAALVWLLVIGGHYERSALYTVFLALGLPLRAIIAACSAMLVAMRSFAFNLQISIFEGALVATILAIGTPGYGGWAGVAASVAGALLSTAIILGAVKARLKKWAAPAGA